MGLTIREKAATVATFRSIQMSLMETLARWVPTTPEMEVKLLFGRHIWELAQHVDALGKRTYELRKPMQFSLPPSDAYKKILQTIGKGLEGTASLAMRLPQYVEGQAR